MTTTSTGGTPVETKAPEPELALQVVWMPDGTPLFAGDIGDANKTINRISAEGYQVFYVLGNYRGETMVTPQHGKPYAQKGPAEPRLFKVVKNFMGRSVQLVDAVDFKLDEFKEMAWYGMPPIPWSMVDRIDTFFRAIEEKHSSEAIVILTYDPRCNTADGDMTSEGWGVLVPTQTNNAGHCRYVQDSIVDEKDDEVIVVGSAHSHPKMSAFASHTDEGDQMSFDGLHITFGWTGARTEFHIELQMGGVAYTLKPEQVFEKLTKGDPFPELEEWTKKVTKEAAANRATSNWQGNNGAHSGGGSGYGGTLGRDPAKHYDKSGKVYALPATCPNPKEVTLCARLLNAEEKKCPVCANFFRKDSIDRRRCWDCLAYLMLPGESLDDILTVRGSFDAAPSFELLPNMADKAVVVWERKENDDKTIETSTVELFAPSPKA